MGLHVAAVDVGEEKVTIAQKQGAEIVVDAKTQDPASEIKRQISGAHGALVTAVSTGACKETIGMLPPWRHLRTGVCLRENFLCLFLRLF